MCLSKLVPIEHFEGEGWKLFRHPNQTYETLFYHKKGLRSGVWIKDMNTYLIPLNEFDPKSDTYPTGFHIFLSYQDAKAYRRSGWSVRKVQYRNAVAQGFQNFVDSKHISHQAPTVIAKEMMILEEPK